MAFLNTELFSRVILLCACRRLLAISAVSCLARRVCCSALARARCAAATPSAIWLTWSPFSCCNTCTNAARPIRVDALLVVSSSSGVVSPPFALRRPLGMYLRGRRCSPRSPLLGEPPPGSPGRTALAGLPGGAISVVAAPQVHGPAGDHQPERVNPCIAPGLGVASSQ